MHTRLTLIPAGSFHVPNKPSGDPVHADLIRACFERARTPSLDHLLSQGAHIDHKDGIECTPLHHAVFGGSMETISAIVQAGADVNAVNEWFGTPLCLAAIRGDLAAVDFLIRHNASVNKDCNRLGSTAHAACVRGDLAVIRAFHTAGASWKAERNVCVDAFCYLLERSQVSGFLEAYHKSLESQDRHVQSPGAMAVRFRHSEAVEFCVDLADGLSANEVWKWLRDPSHRKGPVTLLMLAMSTLDSRTAESLLEHGANVGALDEKGRGALIYALKPTGLDVTNAADLERCVSLLLRHGVNINGLYSIVTEPNPCIRIPRLLLEGGVPMIALTLTCLDATTPSLTGESFVSRMTALTYTMAGAHDHQSLMHCIEVLCEHGADPRPWSTFRIEALNWAAIWSSTGEERAEVSKLLMRYPRKDAAGRLL